MILASSLNLDKTDALVNLADDLAVFVRQAVQAGADLDTVERGAFARVLEIGRAAVDLLYPSDQDTLRGVLALGPKEMPHGPTSRYGEAESLARSHSTLATLPTHRSRIL